MNDKQTSTYTIRRKAKTRLHRVYTNLEDLEFSGRNFISPVYQGQGLFWGNFREKHIYKICKRRNSVYKKLDLLGQKVFKLKSCPFISWKKILNIPFHREKLSGRFFSRVSLVFCHAECELYQEKLFTF